MTKGLNIVSRLTFENIPDGTLPTSIPDENQYSNYSYTRYANSVNVDVETVNGIKFIKLASSTSNSKIYAQNVITDQSKKNFQAEFDVIFDSISTEMTLVAIGSSNALTTMLRVVAYADPTKGIALVNDIRSINSYYKFETNKKYTICVGMKDNVISMYINGTIIGYSYSEEFTNNLNVVTPASIILGSTALINAGASGGMLTGKLGNINISSGPSVKHEESYTKYGTNLVSFLNFENLLTTGTYKAGLEAVYEGIEWRGVESATYSNRYGNIKNISTDLTGEFTVMFSLKKFKIANANILKYGNYSVDYAAGFIPVPEPDVEVNEYTTSALNFENGLVDQIGTTVWTKEGTADITSVNKIFGENSFETKALGDSLYTNSNVVTGGSTPFTIEFYALIKDTQPFLNTFHETVLSFSHNRINSFEGIYVDKLNRIIYTYNTNMVDFQNRGVKINKCEINKISLSYDGAALRLFINDKLHQIYGSMKGIKEIYDNIKFLTISNNTDSSNVLGIIDNINIHDGIATKVRDPDPYEEFLVVDLAFDGENNSTKIVDNGNKRITDISAYVKSYLNFNSILNDDHMNWVPNGDISISSNDKKFGVSSLYGNGGNLISDATSDITIGTNDYSISFFYKPTSLMDWRAPFQKGAWNSVGGLTWIFGNSSTKVCANGNDSGNIIHGMSNNNWYHVALCRKNGIAYLHIDGILKHNWNQNHNLNNTSPLEIFKGGGIVGGDVGFIDDFVYVVGYAMYHDDFIPPTREFNNTVNEYNKWTVNGNAKLSTTQKFDGFSSLYLDGSSHVTTKFSDAFNFIGSDITLSFEFIPTNLATTVGQQQILIASWDASNNRSFFILIEKESTGHSIQFGISQDGLAISNQIKFNVILTNNVRYKIDLIISNNVTLYLNGNIVNSFKNNYIQQYVSNVSMVGVGSHLNNSSRFIGYIKNFKIYKGVVVIPEDPTGKIQLDFDNNFNDKYGNSTWTNNGVTFDQANSVKGYSAYFNGNSTTTLTSSSASLNMGMNNFVFEYDNYRTLKAPSNLQMYIFANSIAPVGGTGSNIRITKGATTDTIDTTFMTYDTVPANRTYPSNNDYVNTWYNDRFVKKQSTILSYKNDVIYDCINDSTSNFNFISGGSAVFGKRSDWGTSYKGYIDNFKSYKEDLVNRNATFYNIISNSNQIQYTTSGDSLRLYYLNSAASHPISRYVYVLNDVSPCKDYIIEVKAILKKNNQSMCRISANTTSFSTSTEDYFGYSFYIYDNIIKISKGGNGIEAWTDIKSATIPTHLIDDDFHIFKISKIGNAFNLYIDDILYIETTDNSYINVVSTICFGTNNYQNTRSTIIQYVKMYAHDTGKEIYYRDWKSKIETVIDKPVVHLPLETNAINIGFTPLTISSVGSPTYTTVDGKKCIKFESGKYLTVNQNNIFNLGTSSDFYIEFDFYIIDLSILNVFLSNHTTFTNNSSCILYANKKIEFQFNNGTLKIYPTINTCEIGQFNNFKLYRMNNAIYMNLNGVETIINENYNINFSISNLFLGKSGWSSTDRLNGYISNFKMFVGTSQPPETYNDKKVLDLDFKPTRKSYLFKDNNNKCVIHPVNITQRDYQDSQYCCTFNGTNQYLQLGKNDLLNFGSDDFVIELDFKLTGDYTYNAILCAGGNTVSRSYISIFGSTHPNFPNKIGLTNSGGGGVIDSVGITNIIVGNRYNVKFIRHGSYMDIYINDVLDLTVEINNQSYNFNLNGNTVIGRVMSNETEYFKGTIYSIKVLRNTTDLSLLEDENTDVIIGDTTLTLSNGTDSQEVIFDNKDQNDFRFVHSNDSTKLIVNEQILEVPNVENELNELSLFTDFNAEVKDIKTYNIAFEDEDTFSGNVPIHTQFGEIEDIDTVTDIFHVVDQGDFIVNGFFEGRPEDSRYQIRNRFDYIVMHTDSGPFNYNGINERYIDDYEIYLPDTNEAMPIPTEPMIRGYITVSITPTECEGINFGVKVFRRSDNKLIGIYDFNNYICAIDNLDCNKRYDCIIFDQDVNLESRCLSNRTPIPY